MENNNAINWFEIPVSNMKRAKEFYQKIFDITLQDMPMEGMSYAFWPNGGIGGALAEGPNYVPSQTGSLCFLNGGDDLENVLKKINNAGGNVVQPKTSIGPHGFIARFTDTEGNLVALHSKN